VLAARCVDFAALPPDVRKVSDLPIATELILGLRPIFEMNKFQISRDSQALYITMVAKDPLPVFQTDAIKQVTCEALNEARGSGGFLIWRRGA
jgi:hypothetical protein